MLWTRKNFMLKIFLSTMRTIIMASTKSEEGRPADDGRGVGCVGVTGHTITEL